MHVKGKAALQHVLHFGFRDVHDITVLGGDQRARPALHFADAEPFSGVRMAAREEFAVALDLPAAVQQDPVVAIRGAVCILDGQYGAGIDFPLAGVVNDSLQLLGGQRSEEGCVPQQMQISHRRTHGHDSSSRIRPGRRWRAAPGH